MREPLGRLLRWRSVRLSVVILFGIATTVRAQDHIGPSLPQTLAVPGGWAMVPVPIELPGPGRHILRTEPRADAPIAFRPRRGEKFVVLRQAVRVIRPWLVIARDTLTIQTISGPRTLAVGDTLYGLGGKYVWFRGRQDTLQDSFTYPSGPRLRFICSQQISFWLEFQRENGQTGWLNHGVMGPCREGLGQLGPSDARVN